MKKRPLLGEQLTAERRSRIRKFAGKVVQQSCGTCNKVDRRVMASRLQVMLLATSRTGRAWSAERVLGDVVRAGTDGLDYSIGRCSSPCVHSMCRRLRLCGCACEVASVCRIGGCAHHHACCTRVLISGPSHAACRVSGGRRRRSVGGGASVRLRVSGCPCAALDVRDRRGSMRDDPRHFVWRSRARGTWNGSGVGSARTPRHVRLR